MYGSCIRMWTIYVYYFKTLQAGWSLCQKITDGVEGTRDGDMYNILKRRNAFFLCVIFTLHVLTFERKIFYVWVKNHYFAPLVCTHCLSQGERFSCILSARPLLQASAHANGVVFSFYRDALCFPVLLIAARVIEGVWKVRQSWYGWGTLLKEHTAQWDPLCLGRCMMCFLAFAPLRISH